MPTKKQLHFVLESELEFFGGAGVPKEHFEGSTENQGFTVQKWTDIPVSRKNRNSRRGKRVGRYILSRKTNTLKLIIDRKK